MKILEFKIIAVDSGRDFEDEINELLNEGWELYGNPYSLMSQISEVAPMDGLHCQGMVRRAKK